MNPAVLFLFLLSAPVAGCALRSGAQAGEEPRSRVDMALADASDSITRGSRHPDRGKPRDRPGSAGRLPRRAREPRL